jgi:hypothetical protein
MLGWRREEQEHKPLCPEAGLSRCLLAPSRVFRALGMDSEDCGGDRHQREYAVERPRSPLCLSLTTHSQLRRPKRY